MSDVKHWVGFNIVSGIGPARFQVLLDHFGDLEAAWRAPAYELKRAGLDRRSIDNLLETRNRISLDDEMEKIERVGVQVLTWQDDAYPPQLRHIHSPPRSSTSKVIFAPKTSGL